MSGKIEKSKETTIAAMLPDDRSLRVKRIKFSLMPQGVWVITKALSLLPADTIIVNVAYEYDRGQWSLYVCSDKFEKITEGALVPEILVKIDHRAETVEIVTPLAPESFMDALEGL